MYALLFHVYLWQLKEYRIDRMLAHLSTQKGREPFYDPLSVGKVTLILLLLTLPISGAISQSSILAAATVLYAVEVAIQVAQALHRRMHRPVPTMKSLAVLATAMLVQFALAGFVVLRWEVVSPLPGGVLPLTLSLLVLDRALPLVASTVALLYGPATAFLKERTIRSAAAKRRRLSDLKVVGITGSFGKTSTKEFVSAILSTRYDVARTPGNTNTAIGVARAMNSLVNAQHEVFVVEMGAYKVGEIAEMCNIVCPQIAVITAIEDQHLALFGSLENVAKAKMELVHSLPSTGVAVLNIDSKGIRDNLERAAACRKVLYSLERETDISVHDIIIGPKTIDFVVNMHNTAERFHANLVGKQNIPSILAATAVAVECGMSLNAVARAVGELRPIKRTMYPILHPTGALLVDDTYSASTGSVMAALDYLAALANVQKIFVFSEILELGPRAQDEHHKVGLRAARICDLTIISSRNYAEFLSEGGRAGGAMTTGLLVDEDPQSAAARIRARLGSQTVVVFEGRGPERILAALTGQVDSDQEEVP